MKQVIHTEKAPKAIGPYSQAIKNGNMVFVSGQVPFDPQTMEVIEGGAKEQAARSLESLKEILAEAGATFADVVNYSIHKRYE